MIKRDTRFLNTLKHMKNYIISMSPDDPLLLKLPDALKNLEANILELEKELKAETDC